MDVCERDILNYPEAFFFCRIALSQTSYNAQHNWKNETAEMQSGYTPINLKGWKKNIPQLSKHREKAFSAGLSASGVNPAVSKKLMGHKNEDTSASDKDVFLM